MKTSFYIGILAGLLITGGAAAQEQFGRFFSTPSERERLDQLRQRPRQEVVIEVPQSEREQDEPEEEEVIPLDLVTLKGVVYRGDRKSTAWLNDGNTYEGDIGSQYTTVDEIGPGQVTVDFVDGDMEVKLRVGQSYEPATRQIREIITK